MGKYELTARERFTDNVRTQENGSLTYMVWCELLNKIRQGVGVYSNALNVSVSEYALDNLATAEHPHEFKKAGTIRLNVDFKQASVAGNDLWFVATHEPYLLKEKGYSYSYTIKSIW